MQMTVEFDDGNERSVDISLSTQTLRQDAHLHRLLGDERYDLFVQGKRYPDIIQALICVHFADEFPELDPEAFDVTVTGPGDSGKADNRP